ncbi:MAG: hypothetical protein AAF399_20450 [Bacteroidota bacterium]
MNHLLVVIGVTALLFQSMTAQAQEAGLPLQGRVSILANPSYFVLGGYHISPMYHFPQRWSVGLTAQGGFQLPEFVRDDFFQHQIEDLAIDWAYAIGVEVNYRFSRASFDKGFYVNGSVGYEGWRATEAANSDEFRNWFTSISLGYNWFPFRRDRLHLGLRYSLIFLLNNTEPRDLGNGTYQLRRIVPPSIAPSVFIGWRL